MRPEATAGSAPLQITNAQPQSAWLASAAAIILWVPAGMTASTLQAEMDVREIRVCGRHLPRVPCVRAGSVRTMTRGAKDGA